MPRPKKSETIESQKKEVATAEKSKKSDGLIALKYFAKEGKLFIGGETYNAVDGVVKVKPEHYLQVQEHIKLIGG